MIIMLDKKDIVSKHLEDKVRELYKILPKDVFNFDDYYFAGGCIYSLWNNKEPKDYDLFCKNKKAINKLIKYFKENKGLCNIITDNAITMGKFQFIIAYVGQPEVEVMKFDFKHNMFFYDKETLHTVSDWSYLDSNKLEFNTDRARNVLNTVSRIPKFVSRGMEITQAEILDILEVATRPSKIISERRAIKQRKKSKSGY